jgi:hypothetical protein
MLRHRRWYFLKLGRIRHRMSNFDQSSNSRLNFRSGFEFDSRLCPKCLSNRTKNDNFGKFQGCILPNTSRHVTLWSKVTILVKFDSRFLPKALFLKFKVGFELRIQVFKFEKSKFEWIRLNLIFLKFFRIKHFPALCSREIDE